MFFATSAVCGKKCQALDPLITLSSLGFGRCPLTALSKRRTSPAKTVFKRFFGDFAAGVVRRCTASCSESDNRDGLRNYGICENPRFLLLHGLFQKGYLPGVIDVVLDYAVQQDINRVSRSRRDLFQPSIVNFF